MELSEEEIIEWYFEFFKMKEDLGEIKLKEKPQQPSNPNAPLPIKKANPTKPITKQHPIKKNGIR